MLDALYVVIVAAFFAATYALVRFCAALRDQGKRR